MLIDLRKLIRVIPIKRGRAFLIRKLSRFFAEYRYEIIEIFGHPIKIVLRDNASIGLYLNYGKIKLEKEIFSLLHEIVEPDDVFWDVGANIGFYTLYLIDKCKVIAFEPNNNLSSNLKVAVFAYSSVAVYDYALSNNDEENDFYLDKESSDLSSLLGEPGRNKITVMTKTIDSLIYDKKFKAPTIIKIDVEGFEYYVLAGFKSINLVRPLIIFEYIEDFGRKINHTLEDIIRLLGPDWNIFRFMTNGELNPNYRHNTGSTNNYLATHKTFNRLSEIEKYIIK